MRSGEIGRLPLKRADRRDRPKRIFCAQAPQFVRIRRTVEHVPMQRPPMNSMGDEKRVEPRSPPPRYPSSFRRRPSKPAACRPGRREPVPPAPARACRSGGRACPRR